MDPRFLEVSRGTWNLRSKHHEDLALARPEADTIAEIILAQRGRQNVFTLHSQAQLPERKTHMVIECLRKDPRVRYLGKGVFCPRGELSTAILEIQEAMTRAMGEIVLSRFIENQHPRRRRLTECLLHDNRAFVEPFPDRIDMLSNYPFSTDRLDQLERLIREQLEKGRGYAKISELHEIVSASDFGGDWLSEHMLLDLLRRNSSFELLPGGLVAQPELGLAGWIQQRARECLRQTDAALSPNEVLAEVPELAAFADALEELLEQDPMVQCVDGERYCVV